MIVQSQSCVGFRNFAREFVSAGESLYNVWCIWGSAKTPVTLESHWVTPGSRELPRVTFISM